MLNLKLALIRTDGVGVEGTNFFKTRNNYIIIISIILRPLKITFFTNNISAPDK